MIRIGANTVEIDDDCRLVTTTLADGLKVLAVPHAEGEQISLAAALGYPDTWAMTREHDLCHSLVARLLGLPQSPALSAAPFPKRWSDPLYALEEAAVLAVQRLARAHGVDLVEVWR